MLGWIILILVIVLLLACIIVFFSYPLKLFVEKHRHKKRVYKTLHYFCDEADQLMLNNVVLYLPGDKSEPTKFDHIVFADKYIYVVSSVFFEGGLYGNVEDSALFRRDDKGKIIKIINPVVQNENKVRKLEAVLDVPHSDKMFVSVVVYNPSLIVPKGIAKKDQTSWFLPVTELEKTLKIAEKDDVTSIDHTKTQALVNMLKDRSDKIKEEISKQEKAN